jgi:hypothetical protein
MFDQAAHGKFAVYEKVSALNWFRGVVYGAYLHRGIMSVQWCGNVLRMVAPHMWLCRNLINQVNRAALEQVAQVTETNGAYKIALHQGCVLDEMEVAFLRGAPTWLLSTDTLPATWM